MQMRFRLSSFVAIAAICVSASRVSAQDTTAVVPISPPASPLPPEAATATVTRFSFIAYGDTRGALDGIALQTNHSLVVNSMLRAVGYGNTLFLFFDSIIAADSTQYNWIRGQLEGLNRKRFVNIVVVCHNPGYSSGPHGAFLTEVPGMAMRYSDASGVHRLDEIVTEGGGAPLYGYVGEPDLRAYIAANAASRLNVTHLVKPGMDPGRNPYHYLIVHVDGEKIRIKVIGVDWGQNFQPYRTNAVSLDNTSPIQ